MSRKGRAQLPTNVRSAGHDIAFSETTRQCAINNPMIQEAIQQDDVCQNRDSESQDSFMALNRQMNSASATAPIYTNARVEFGFDPDASCKWKDYTIEYSYAESGSDTIDIMLFLSHLNCRRS